MSEENVVKDSEEKKPELLSTRSERSLLFLVMGAVLILDQLSKFIVERQLPLNQSWAPIPDLAAYFRITHVSNTGAAFGLFPSGSTLFMGVAVVVTIVIILYNRQLPANQHWYRVALGMMLGGALGNFIDRLRIDHVTDFVDVGPVPVFNVADASIVMGVILMAFLMLREERRTREDTPTESVVVEVPSQEPGETAEDHSMLWND